MSMKDHNKRGFASDNWAGVHPAVMMALSQINEGHVPAYGDDEITQKAKEAFDALFGRKVYTHFVWSGTGANIAALSHLCKPYSAILCAKSAHILIDECGAPERITGCKLMGVTGHEGKVCPDDLAPFVLDIGNQHKSQPSVISITQSTELGTLYSPEEVKALADFAHSHSMELHMDGARIANAVAALGCDIAEITWKAGVDALCFGGTKNGMMFGEAVVFFDESLGKTFPFTRKNTGQLYSKGRFLAAQFCALLQDDLWLENARHANRMAKMLSQGLEQVAGVKIMHPVSANEIFCTMPQSMAEGLHREYAFYEEDTASHVFRLVTAFDSQEQEIRGFLALAQKLAEL